ncbi:uncharacterized protein FIBRA_03213 [Fibroporia radiculosa]|uniref:Uncharacterized protein n=1 Tax=Fibroporia radiculosa TaxID=599839 RepID=J4GNC8_9APHY|nr:uncharacterized protein FIBRA_03213 [Fibroporia radiculosa]CCM01165.1 predicted protein [Fibroporia radiculosa]
MAVSNLIVSCTIFALIPIKIYVNFRQVVLSEQHEGAKLLILLQKDGTLHLMTILFIDITRLAVLNSQTVVGSMTYIVEAFISILVSRFILDARTVYAQDQGETTLGDQTTLQFANRQDDMSDSAEEYNSQSRISTIRIGFEPSQFGQETLVSRVHIRNAIQSIKDSLAEDEDPGIFV